MKFLPKDKYFALLLIICVVFFLIRAVLLSQGTSFLDGDEAVVALMGKKILEGKDFPVYFWGQGYMGSFEAYIVAFSCFIFGITDFAVKIVPTIFWYLSIPFFYQVWRRLFSVRVSFAASLLLVVPGVFLFEWLAKARGGYSEIVFLSAVILWLYPYIAKLKLRNDKKSFMKITLYGLLLGFSFWLNSQIISLIIPIGIAFAYDKSQKLRISKERALKFMSGILPVAVLMVFYEVTHNFGFMRFMLRGQATESFIPRIFTNIGSYFAVSLPVLFGVSLSAEVDLIALAIYILFLLSAVYFAISHKVSLTRST